MIGWIHCFETKADCHLGVARKQKEKEEEMGKDRQQPGTRYVFPQRSCNDTLPS